MLDGLLNQIKKLQLGLMASILAKVSSDPAQKIWIRMIVREYLDCKAQCKKVSDPIGQHLAYLKKNLKKNLKSRSSKETYCKSNQEYKNSTSG